MFLRFLSLVLFLAALLPVQASAWWDPAWVYRMKITLDPAAPQVEQVPVVVRLHNGNFAFFGGNQDGSDLRFVAADDRTLLSYHIDRYDAASGIALVWVRLPSMGSREAPGYFWLYYGNPDAQDAQNAGETYDRNQSLVLHFGAREESPRDHSAHANHPVAMRAVTTSAGPIDTALKLDGRSALRIPASPSLRLSANQGFSLSVWLKPGNVTSESVLFEQRDGDRALMVILGQAGVYARVERGQGDVIETPRVALTPGAWQHLGVVSADRLAVYVGGREAGSVAGRLADMGGDVHVGMDSVGRRAFAGEIDELQLSNIARTSAWMRVAAGQGPDGTLLVYGAKEEEGAAGNAYLGILRILADSVSLEGWVIMALIGMLGLVSLDTGIGKALYLRRTEKANRTFLGRMDAFPLDPASPEAANLGVAGDIKDSSLLRLYQHAMAELKRILDLHQQQGLGRRLSPQ